MKKLSKLAFLTRNKGIEKSLKILLENETLYFLLKQNCIKARAEYNWQNEEKKLIGFYKKFDKKS